VISCSSNSHREWRSPRTVARVKSWLRHRRFDRYALDGRPPVTLKAGDVLFIPAGTIHAAKRRHRQRRGARQLHHRKRKARAHAGRVTTHLPLSHTSRKRTMAQLATKTHRQGDLHWNDPQQGRATTLRPQQRRFCRSAALPPHPAAEQLFAAAPGRLLHGARSMLAPRSGRSSWRAARSRCRDRPQPPGGLLLPAAARLMSAFRAWTARSPGSWQKPRTVSAPIRRRCTQHRGHDQRDLNRSARSLE